MNKISDLQDPVGQLRDITGDITKKTREDVVIEPVKSFEKVEQQAGVKPTATEESGQDNKSVDNSAKDNLAKDNRELVKAYYAKSDNKKDDHFSKIALEISEKNPEKSIEEIQKMATVRQQLEQQHKTNYYDPTFVHRPQKQEPRPGEQTEEEKEKKQMEALGLQKEEEKKEALSVKKGKGTHEMDPGAAG